MPGSFFGNGIIAIIVGVHFSVGIIAFLVRRLGGRLSAFRAATAAFLRSRLVVPILGTAVCSGFVFRSLVTGILFILGRLLGVLRLCGEQSLTVGEGDLVVIGMNFAEGEETVAVAAIFDERSLKTGLYPRDLGKIDITADLVFVFGFEVEFIDLIAPHHSDPGFLRVAGIDEHFVCIGHYRRFPRRH